MKGITMCKVLIIPAIKEHRRRETEDFLAVMADVMSKYNSDGLGYAAVDSSGNLFGERWFVNSMAFSKPAPPMTKEEFDLRQSNARALTDKFDKFLKPTRYFAPEYKLTENYNTFGDEPSISKAAAITMHTRMATCEKNLTNVHPFVDQDTSVIHNGVISNSKDFDLKLSTCDSESILISYLEHNVNIDPSGSLHAKNGVQPMSERLEGYYASAVFARDAQGNRILDVFKMNNNNLSIAYVFELETYVLATSDSDIRDVCKVLGFTHDGTIDLNDGYLTRINPFTGEVIQQVHFTKVVPVAKPNFSDHFWKNTSYHNKQNQKETYKPTNVLPYNKNTHKASIDAATFKMMQLTSSIEELSVREVEEFQAASGLWD